MQYLAIIKIVLGLLPVIMDAIKAIEAVLPSGGQGQAKLEALKGIISSAYNAATDTSIKFEAMWPVLQGVITTVVTLFNNTGVFIKK